MWNEGVKLNAVLYPEGESDSMVRQTAIWLNAYLVQITMGQRWSERMNHIEWVEYNMQQSAAAKKYNMNRKTCLDKTENSQHKTKEIKKRMSDIY